MTYPKINWARVRDVGAAYLDTPRGHQALHVSRVSSWHASNPKWVGNRPPAMTAEGWAAWREHDRRLSTLQFNAYEGRLTPEDLAAARDIADVAEALTTDTLERGEAASDLMWAFYGCNAPKEAEEWALATLKHCDLWTCTLPLPTSGLVICGSLAYACGILIELGFADPLALVGA